MSGHPLAEPETDGEPADAADTEATLDSHEEHSLSHRRGGVEDVDDGEVLVELEDSADEGGIHFAAEHVPLNLDADGFHGQLRLSIWADRAMWFRLCRGRAKNGWDFMLSFRGNVGAVSPEQLVEQLISSFTVNPSDLVTVWQIVGPEVERTESKT